MTETNSNNAAIRLVSFSRGRQLVTIGDFFTWHNKVSYEVISFDDGCFNYSPSGLGGAVTINIKNLTTGEIEEWCADSVASGIFSTNNQLVQKQ